MQFEKGSMFNRMGLWGLGVGLAVLSLMFLAGYKVGYTSAPKEILDNEVKQSGVFGLDTKRVLSATVTSLKAENQLIVYRFSGETHVTGDHSEFWGWLKGSQDLFVPASVTYFLDMKNLGQEDVSLDEKSKTILVKMPSLKLSDIAFQPEQARQYNNGLITLVPNVAQHLTSTNYDSARKSFTKMAQQTAVIDLAKEQAQKNVTAYFEIPLRAIGATDVRVRAYFPGDK